MLKQRMLSAILIVLTAVNCTTQTMLVSAEEIRIKPTTIAGFEPEVKYKKVSNIKYMSQTKTVNGASGKEIKINKGIKVKETKRYSNGWSQIKYQDIEYLIQTKYLCKNRWNIRLTKEERELLAKIVFLEANLESEAGQCAVVEVIFNRMISEEFGNNLRNVLSQKGQFTSWKLLHKANPQKSNYNAIDKVLAGKSNILTNDYLYFSVGGHKKHSGIIIIGNHQFCKE